MSTLLYTLTSSFEPARSSVCVFLKQIDTIILNCKLVYSVYKKLESLKCNGYTLLLANLNNYFKHTWIDIFLSMKNRSWKIIQARVTIRWRALSSLRTIWNSLHTISKHPAMRAIVIDSGMRVRPQFVCLSLCARAHDAIAQTGWRAFRSECGKPFVRAPRGAALPGISTAISLSARIQSTMRNRIARVRSSRPRHVRGLNANKWNQMV